MNVHEDNIKNKNTCGRSAAGVSVRDAGYGWVWERRGAVVRVR